MIYVVVLNFTNHGRWKHDLILPRTQKVVLFHFIIPSLLQSITSSTSRSAGNHHTRTPHHIRTSPPPSHLSWPTHQTSEQCPHSNTQLSPLHLSLPLPNPHQIQDQIKTSPSQPTSNTKVLAYPIPHPLTKQRAANRPAAHSPHRRLHGLHISLFWMRS
jgi:hypothetical protein